MELGYSITSFHSPDIAPGTAADRILERASVAANAGYESVEAGDHHNVHGGGYLQNVPMTARLAAEFDHVAGMFLLPLYHPVLLAEQVATLDALAEQFDLWCGVGHGSEQFRAFDVPIRERAPRFEESLDLIQRLWSEESVSHDGEFYSVDDIAVDGADPRICIGGTAEPAVNRAGRLGDAWVANADVSLDAIRERIGWLETAGGGDVIVRRDAMVLDDDSAAKARATALLEGGYRGWPADADWLLAGSPETVAADLADLQAAGAESVVVRPMTDEEAMATLQGVARARELL